VPGAQQGHRYPQGGCNGGLPLLLFLDAKGHIVAREEFQAETDEGANARARSIYRERAFRCGFELWRNAKMVHAEPAKQSA